MQFKTAALHSARGRTEERNLKKGDLPQLLVVKSQSDEWNELFQIEQKLACYWRRNSKSTRDVTT
jgi:hypothetical protein